MSDKFQQLFAACLRQHLDEARAGRSKKGFGTSRLGDGIGSWSWGLIRRDCIKSALQGQAYNMTKDHALVAADLAILHRPPRYFDPAHRGHDTHQPHWVGHGEAQ